MKVLSLFSGIGAFEKALTNMGVKYELVNYCEIDKYASKSYSAIHGVPENKNLGDITKVDSSKLPSDIDILTYGFPCQDISISGRMRGFEHEGERTRSGLFFEALRLIEGCKPKIAICENVKNLTSKKFEKEFSIVLESLEEAGYKNYWQVLNAKDYGVPQNRERVFIISIREDIDKGYEFPKPFPLELKLLDMCDKTVASKYFMSEKSIAYVCATGTKNFHYVPEIDLDVARPLTATMHKMHRASEDNYLSEDYILYGNKVKIKDGVLVREATKKDYTGDYKGDSINFEHPNSKTHIRKLTPLECFRLMGFDDEDFRKVDGVNSDTQLYKQAGNSIVVDIIEELYEQLFKLYWNDVNTTNA